MELPYSRSQIDRLGKRLTSGDAVDPADAQQLTILLFAYREILNEVVRRVERATGLRGSSRIKTRGTTMDKLRRQRGLSLKSMQDLAGVRLVVGRSRAEQDRVVAQLVAEFTDGRRAPQVIDRRADPTHGYRAVHVVVYLGDAQAEIQVRTRLQHEWAELFEKFADRVGRGIRYGEPVAWWGEPPTAPEDERLIVAEIELAHIRLDWAQAASRWINAVESLEVAGADVPPEEWEELTVAIRELRDAMSGA